MEAHSRRLIASRSEFLEALRSAIALAAAEGAREIVLADASFADWPLSEREVVDQLTRWASSRRRLLLLAKTFDEMPRRQARWLEWRRPWSHVVECRSNDEIEASEFPSICLVPGHRSIRLADPVHWRGVVSNEPADEVSCREAIDAVSQRSTAALPVTSLGL